VFEGAKYLLKDDHGSVPYQNKNYYFNDNDVTKAGQNGRICNYTITEEDGDLHNFWKSDGKERVEKLYYKCAATEVCCGLECCASGTSTITTNTVVTQTSHRDENGTLIIDTSTNTTTTLIKQTEQVKHAGQPIKEKEKEKHRSAAVACTPYPIATFLFAICALRAVVY
jgi:hypothetical protein